ncbi:MAG: hypothetical protein HYS12_23720 [Planctomycetes bacterium]|nr:hypothetical protein [Planctomycetota bacterium]
MRVLRSMVLGCGLLLAGPALAQNQDSTKLIVGKWETSQKVGDKDIKVVVDFAKDGRTVVVTVRDVSLSGTYQVKEGGKVEVELNLKDRTSKGTYEVKATPDTLELKDSNGKVDKFNRVK